MAVMVDLQGELWRQLIQCPRVTVSRVAVGSIMGLIGSAHTMPRSGTRASPLPSADSWKLHIRLNDGSPFREASYLNL